MTILDGGNAFSTYPDPETGGRYAPITRTVAQVMRAVKRVFGDESGVQLEDQDIIGWINDAQDTIVNKNKILKAKSGLPITIGQASYQFPNESVHQIESVLINGKRIPNMSVAQAEETISEHDPNGEVEGFPQFWYEWAGELVFWPKPIEAGGITLRYSSKPIPVVTSSDKLSLPDTYYQDVVNFVLKQAYEMDENETMMQAKGQEFEASLASRIDEERTAQTMTYGTITVVDDY